jgi:hypothetical protein
MKGKTAGKTERQLGTIDEKIIIRPRLKFRAALIVKVEIPVSRLMIHIRRKMSSLNRNDDHSRHLTGFLRADINDGFK